MSTLLLRLAGPMQSWGSDSRFTRRSTEHAPTKSGVVGLLAAAAGRRRTDPLEDLLLLRFGVRIDQPGRVERDFQTAQGHALTTRYFLSDAIFLAAVEGPGALIDELDEALRNPGFPLYLGRRSFPPVGPVTLGVHEGSLWDVLYGEPWRAASWWRRRQGPTVHLELRVDAEAVPEEFAKATTRTAVYRDAPESFDPRLRSYGWRSVAFAGVDVKNPDAEPRKDAVARSHDPFTALGGA